MERPEFRILPDFTVESRPYWTGGEQGQLLIYRCRGCGHWFHPPAPACFRCRSRDVGPEPASGRATVAAFTVNAHPWLPGFPPPYVVALVELEDEPDVRLTTNIVDCPVEMVSVGMPVEVCFEEREDVWLPLFRPVGS